MTERLARFLLFGLVVVTPGALLADNAVIPQSQCGVNCLYACMQFMGIDASLDRLYDEITTDGSGTVSLRQLAEHARRYGLHVTAVRTPSVRQMRNDLGEETTAIVHISVRPGADHFITMLRTSDELWMVDYPRHLLAVSDESVAEICSASRGALVLSREPMSTRTGETSSDHPTFFTIVSAFSMCAAVVFLTFVGYSVWRSHRRVIKDRQ